MIRTLPLVTLLAGTLPADAAPTEWTLDLGHAHIGWEINHMGLSRTVGRFNRYDGTFMIDEDNPANSRITFTIDATSIDSNHTERDGHLRHSDYLDAESNPAITFSSTDIVMLTPNSGKLTGDLNMRGQSAPITLDFTMVRDRTYPDFVPNYDEVRVVGFEATGEILRLDHGMDFIAFLDSPTGLSVDVDLHFDLVQCAGAPDSNVPCTWGR